MTIVLIIVRRLLKTDIALDPQILGSFFCLTQEHDFVSVYGKWTKALELATLFCALCLFLVVFKV